MAVLIPAVETGLVPAVSSRESDTLAEPVLVPPPPGPGDPGIPLPAVPLSGLRVQGILQHVVTHDVVGELRTLAVNSWELDLEPGTPGSIDASASSSDPTWALAASATSSHRGRPVYEWDPKGHELLLGVDGEAEALYNFREPLDIGGDRVAVRGKTPEVLLADHTLGRVEQLDLLGGWGDFERYEVGTTPPGLILVPDPGHTMTGTVVYDGIRGRKCLELVGRGVAHTPHVPSAGADGYGRTIEAISFIKVPDNVSSGAWMILTKTRPAGSLVPWDLAYSNSHAGGNPDMDGRWSDDPIGSKARMSPTSALHHSWGEMRSFDGAATRYDLVSIKQGILSGFPSPRTYDRYVDRFLRHLQRAGLGGSSWGIRTHIHSHTTASIQLNVAHNQHHSGPEVLAMVDSTVDGGAAWHVDASGTAIIEARRGQIRTDIALTPDHVLECRWAQDPGAEVDDFIADTGRGSGTLLVTSTISQPRVADRHRITRIAQPPAGTLNAVDAWTRRTAALAARRNITCEVDVRWNYGRLIGLGDTLWVPLADGLLGSWTRPMRVLRMRFQPREMLVTLTMGTDDGA